MTAMHHIDGYKLINFASQIDDNTIEQAKETAAIPFVHPHIALMPDAHSGKGPAVGAVIPTIDAVNPAAVGVDIGCGMIAARTIYSGPDLAQPTPPMSAHISAKPRAPHSMKKTRTYPRFNEDAPTSMRTDTQSGPRIHESHCPTADVKFRYQIFC